MTKPDETALPACPVREALIKSREWVEANTAPVRFSPEAAKYGEEMLREIDAALAAPCGRQEIADSHRSYLEDERNRLLNSLDHGSYADGKARSRIVEINALLAASPSPQEQTGAAIKAADLVKRLEHAMTTAMSDDYTKPSTEDRNRHVARVQAMSDAIDFILEVAALPSPPAGEA